MDAKGSYHSSDGRFRYTAEKLEGSGEFAGFIDGALGKPQRYGLKEIPQDNIGELCVSLNNMMGDLRGIVMSDMGSEELGFEDFIHSSTEHAYMLGYAKGKEYKIKVMKSKKDRTMQSPPKNSAANDKAVVSNVIKINFGRR
jgi:hypothetical protein